MARTWPGKVCHLQAVPVEDIAVFPAVDPITQTVLQPFQLRAGKAWINIKLLSSGSAFTEQNSFTAAGTIWDQQVRGYMWGQSKVNHLQANNWTQRRWVLVAHEIGSGMSYIVGNRFRGARLSVIYDNEDTSLTTLQFNHQARDRAYLYYPPEQPIDNSEWIIQEDGAPIISEDALYLQQES